MVLPPIYRFLSQAIHLPHRRFYTPATEYKSVPSEFHLFDSSTTGRRGDRGGTGPGAFGLRPIPSVIDLPTSHGMGFEVEGIGSGVSEVSRDLKMRVSGAGVSAADNGMDGNKVEKTRNGSGYTTSNDKESTGKDGQIPDVKRYDADGKGPFFLFFLKKKLRNR